MGNLALRQPIRTVLRPDRGLYFEQRGPRLAVPVIEAPSIPSAIRLHAAQRIPAG